MRAPRSGASAAPSRTCPRPSSVRSSCAKRYGARGSIRPRSDRSSSATSSTPRPRTCTSRRVAALDGGLAHETPAFTLNRLCGSGLQAIVSAAQTILLGDTDVAVAGGAESMSRGASTRCSNHRWGQRMGDGSDRRHDGRRVDRPVRYRPHGDHRRGGCRALRDHARDSGRVRDRESPPRDRRDHRAAASRSRSSRSSSRRARVRCVFDTDEHARADAIARGYAEAAHGVPKRRNGHGRQRVGDQRRGGRRGVDGARRRGTQRSQADGTAGCLRPLGRRSEDHGDRTDPGREESARERRPRRRTDRRHRVQRGVRRPGLRGLERAARSTRPR